MRSTGWLAAPHFDTGQPDDWRLRWDVDNPYPSWRLRTTGEAQATIELATDAPLNDATPHSLAVQVTSTGTGRAAVVNEGYWGK